MSKERLSCRLFIYKCTQHVLLINTVLYFITCLVVSERGSQLPIRLIKLDECPWCGIHVPTSGTIT